jgi:hypothetical protein
VENNERQFWVFNTAEPYLTNRELHLTYSCVYCIWTLQWGITRLQTLTARQQTSGLYVGERQAYILIFQCTNGFKQTCVWSRNKARIFPDIPCWCKRTEGNLNWCESCRDEVNVWNVTGRIWEVLWQWMVERAVSFVSLPRQQWCAPYFPLYNTSHFTEMSKDLWTCSSNSITHSQAKFTLMCSHVRSNIVNFKPCFNRIRHVLKKPQAPGHKGNWTGTKACKL